MSKKPILCLDFDGVCHQYTSGWQGADVIPDPPMPGLFEFIYAAAKQFDVHIYSSRSHQLGGVDAMRKWFNTHSQNWMISNPGMVFPVIFFARAKPSAKITIDDRAIQFNGVWPGIASLVNFKPWRIGEGTGFDAKPIRIIDDD